MVLCLYEISVGNGGVASATVNMTINPVNDVPAALNDAGMVEENSTVLTDILSNDSDIDGDLVYINGFIQGTNGVVSQEGNNHGSTISP